MKKFLLICALSVIPVINAVAADIAAGEKKAAVCLACHGKDGHSVIKTYPNLAGQHEQYLVYALKEYQNGARTNPIMVPMAKALSDEDMQNVAAFFAQLK